MRTGRFYLTAMVLTALAFGAGVAVEHPVWAGPPTDALKTSITEVIRVLDDPGMQKPDKKDERRKMLVDIISKRFDFEAMAKRTVGAQWAKRTPEERQEFAASFRTLLSNSYLGRIEEYSGEKIRYVKELSDGEYAEVKTELDTGKSVIPIDYKMEHNNGEWRVYDVIVEGTGLVSNYREQFKRILRKDSFEVLNKMIRDKAAGIEAPGAVPRKSTTE